MESLTAFEGTAMTGTIMTRRNFIGSSSAALVAGSGILPAFPSGGARAIPTAAQKAWQDMELGMFFHYDIPVFKPDWNWRSFKNHPDPSLYSPAKLDTDQWMQAAKAYGAKYVVFVAKHCSEQAGTVSAKGEVYKAFRDVARPPRPCSKGEAPLPHSNRYDPTKRAACRRSGETAQSVVFAPLTYTEL